MMHLRVVEKQDLVFRQMSLELGEPSNKTLCIESPEERYEDENLIVSQRSNEGLALRMG